MLNTVYGVFEEQVKRQPDAPAVIEDGRTLTFAQLAEMAGTVAAGIPAGTDGVGIVMSHRAEMIAAMLAALKMGVVYVPCEPTFPVERIRYMMQESGISFILTEPAFAEKLDGFPLVYTDDLTACAAKHKGSESDSPVPAPDTPAYILYTSGTTGRPKGVQVLNRNVCHYARAFADEFCPGAGDIMLQYSVCSFDIFVEEVYATLLNGAAIAIPPAEDMAPIERVMTFVERHGVTIVSGFPYLLAEMNHLQTIPSSLRLLISGGDVARGRHMNNLVDKAVVYNTYGPSETTVCASYYRCDGGTVLDDGTYPIGHPVLGADIKIMDEEGNELPDGETGEICIFGGGVSNGYIGDHEEENKVFVKQPDGSVMYKSGDLGYILPDGNVAFLHRKDDQIMILGKRVEIMEVESRLNQIGGVAQAIVRAFRDEGGFSYMIAYVVPEDPALKVSEIRKELARNLTPFMIPEFFIKMPAIPLNANGKPDMEKLPVVMRAPQA